MNPARTINLVRTLFVAFTAFIGLQTGSLLFGSTAIGLLAGIAFGLAVVLADRLLRGVTLRLFSSVTFGLLMGTICARLFLASDLLRGSSEEAQWVLSLFIYATCAYLGAMLAMRSNREDFSLIIPYVRFRESSVQEAPVLLDCNIIIDGRLPALCATGFISRTLVVPRFALEEVQRLAESPDALKRERGRRALTRLEEMQRDPLLTVTIHESEPDGNTPVDLRLVQLARILDARLFTNDGNLCSSARLQGVAPLNLNDLARALRPTFSAGDLVELELSKEGREAHQAVGYLGDGTMIVVNHGREKIGSTVSVTISSIVQTSAGRLLFAEMPVG